MLSILPLSAVDAADVESVLDAAFGIDRHHRTAYRIRTGTAPLPDLSFAAVEGDMLVGTLQSWPIQLDDGKGGNTPLILVGPVAVRPDRQRAGIGVALMQTMLDTADQQGEDALVLIGDPDYYERLFGFSAAETAGWDVPGPVERHRLLARLRSRRLNGQCGMLGPRREPSSS